MAAKEQYGCSSVRCRKLEPSGSDHVRRLHLSDHAGERAVSQAIFGHRQHLRVLAALCIQDAIGAKPDLLQSRRVKVEL